MKGTADTDVLRAFWANEAVVGDLVIQRIGPGSFAFSGAGTIRMPIVAVEPGRSAFEIPGTSGESQRAEIAIR